MYPSTQSLSLACIYLDPYAAMSWRGECTSVSLSVRTSFVHQSTNVCLHVEEGSVWLYRRGTTNFFFSGNCFMCSFPLGERSADPPRFVASFTVAGGRHGTREWKCSVGENRIYGLNFEPSPMMSLWDWHWEGLYAMQSIRTVDLFNLKCDTTRDTNFTFLLEINDLFGDG